ncbi:MAG: hypothetical protein IJ394_07950 [Bacteroidales bacterium]|nr:hypothetical protein [Bacteroidales bacterium]
MKHNYLYLTAALIWGAPGMIITAKGISAYTTQSPDSLWWLLMITAAVLAAFFFMFRRIVNKYSDRIDSLPERTSILQTFPVRGWILIIFMMGLGIVLKHIPQIPSEFTASFYSGLGPMLLLSGIRFLTKM